MNDLILFVKLNCSAPAVQHAIDHVESSYTNGKSRFYSTSSTDTQTIHNLLETLRKESLRDHYIVFIEYRKTSDIFIKKLYVGKITEVENQNASYQIHYRVDSEIVSPLVIDNFMKFSNLNLERDFEEDSHISIEESAALVRQLLYATSVPQNIKPRVVEYSPRENEGALSEFAQRNEYCRRYYNALPPAEMRSEYQRDYDRIVHCKAFRRMVDKAQIFTSSKGDHYRTRMTHTLSVAQIARSIASRLKMNVSLTEAIALGHDLGHTPFGHQGERTLNDLKNKHGVAGFKHNYQSMHVASVLEEEYIEYSGLDLSVQVLEGVWKHTKIMERDGSTLICDLRDFLPSDISDDFMADLHPEISFCSTIEGQIVCIADEIAQRSHDLDDALSAGLISIDGLLEILSLKKLHLLKEQIEELKKKAQTAINNNRVFISENELLVSRLASMVIDYFIIDVVHCFESFFADNDEGAQAVKEHFEATKRVNQQLIQFSPEGKVLNEYLETIVTKQVINSPEVAAFDDRAKRVVTQLFNMYYENPRLLHDGTLQRIFIEMKKKTSNVIHFQDGDIALVNDEWKRIKNPDKAASLRDIREWFPDTDFSQYEDVDAFISGLDPESAEYVKVSRYQSQVRDEYVEKKKILVCGICDFISGMTDTYALNEYRKLLY